MKLRFETLVKCSLQVVKQNFNRELFLQLAPPAVGMTLERFDGCSPGNEVHLILNSFGLKQKWISVITAENFTETEWSFIDEGRTIPWPMKSWKHIHQVVSVDENSSMIIDDITFECANKAIDAILYPFLWSSFSIRPDRYKKFFEGK
jgi:ligand-binding SRPBCC domain-containing protein